jgi:hypothetical protein
MISGDVKLAGATINTHAWDKFNPHVQSYVFVLDYVGLQYLLKCGLFDREYDTFSDVILHQEIGMSKLILEGGWNINCLVKGYRNIEYRGLNTHFNPSNKLGTDIVYEGDRCFGREIHPYNVIFMKTNRNVALEAVESLAMED